MKQFIRASLLVLCLAIFVCPAGAQNTLPSSFAAWTASAPGTPVPLAGLDQLLGANAGVFREYIVKAIEQRTYTQGTNSASITLYRLRDPSSAYGAYTFLRSDSMTSVRGRLLWKRLA